MQKLDNTTIGDLMKQNGIKGNPMAIGPGMGMDKKPMMAADGVKQ
jgi:hypothetical protein